MRSREQAKGVISFELRTIVFILGVIVFGLVVFVYFRNAMFARRMANNQAAASRMATAVANMVSAVLRTNPLPSYTSGASVCPNDAKTAPIASVLTSIMNSGMTRKNGKLPSDVLRVRVIDGGGYIYADNLNPDAAMKRDGCFPATNLKNKKAHSTQGDEDLSAMFFKAAAEGGGFVTYQEEAITSGKLVTITTNVVPVPLVSWIVLVDVQ